MTVLGALALILVAAGPSWAEKEPPATFLYKWGEPGNGTGQFRGVRGIVAFDRTASDRILVVVADTGRDLVRAFTSDMMFIDKWGVRGTEPGQFAEPRGVAIDHQGKLLVVDAANHRIQKTEVGTSTFLEKPGETLLVFGKRGSGEGEFEMPTGVAVTPANEILVVDTENHRLQIFDERGEFLRSIGKKGTGPGEFRRPTYAALDSAGNIFVSDTDNNRIQKLDAKGNFVAQIGSIGNQLGRVAEPKGIALDAAGNLWVVDRRNHRVQKFDAEGNSQGVFGKQGGRAGEFNYPEDISIDSKGRLYVTDGMNGRIQVFRPN
ncbi:MAG: 6-bladed beta-propeller [Acidobacteriota bacterium]